MEEEFQQATATKKSKTHNTLPFWGNETSMNLNALILANIQSSSYFRVHLFKLKTYHEVVDEIYYQVKHLEPWERGSRKTSGQTGMCGGVRGVGAGGIVSTAFCLLYKLYTLRLTRKQVNGLLNHTDSPYIRALGFMYIRYTQPPGDLYDWYEDYLLDEEEIDVKAGGGQVMLIGQMVYQFLTKLDWFATLFPRIPVPIQKQIERKVEQYCYQNQISVHQLCAPRIPTTAGGRGFGEPEVEERALSGRNRPGSFATSRPQPAADTFGHRDGGHSPPAPSTNRRREEHSPERDRERCREKQKKKHKRKHSRSRSRSRDRNHRDGHHQRHDYDRSSHTRERDYHSDRRHR